ncbi:hypothetical protein PUN28_000964 [Cardiocondyla obscurior]|uniref:Uncharacterized protein n=1 Tax=Cardiocondyla obscurior TaxID=286306 RepID=A0AAW2H2W4_9HYME
MPVCIIIIPTSVKIQRSTRTRLSRTRGRPRTNSNTLIIEFALSHKQGYSVHLKNT